MHQFYIWTTSVLVDWASMKTYWDTFCLFFLPFSVTFSPFNGMLLIHCLLGWLCSIPFSQNWNLPSSLLGLLKKGQTISRDAKWLLGPDSSPFFWAASIHSLWCQLWYVLLWQEFELLHRTCSSYWVFGVRHFRKILNVVFPWIISLMGMWGIWLSLAFTPCLSIRDQEWWPSGDQMS